MPYINDRWVDERSREARRLNDPYTVAAEKVVAAIENFLYNYDHPGYQNEDYLGWSVMQFDATKRGSGHRANYVEWSPDSDTEALVTAAPPAGPGMAGQTEAYSLPDHEKRRREERKGPFDTGPADDPLPPKPDPLAFEPETGPDKDGDR